MKIINGTPPHGSQPPPPSGTITGRDPYIVGQALYLFIREQQKLPEDQFEWSNCEDAKLILLTLFPGTAKHFAQNDQLAGRKPANLTLEKYDEMTPTLRAASNVVNFAR